MAITGIYICAKLEHAPLIRKLRDEGYPIVSTWIDHNIDESDPVAVRRLWDVVIRHDLLKTTDLIIYLPNESQLKGGFIEAGAAWVMMNVKVHLVSALNDCQLRTYLGTFPQSGHVKRWPHNNIRSVMNIIANPSRPRA